MTAPAALPCGASPFTNAAVASSAPNSPYDERSRGPAPERPPTTKYDPTSAQPVIKRRSLPKSRTSPSRARPTIHASGNSAAA